MVGRLAIPYLTPSGVVNLKFRCIKHDSCKANGCTKYLCLTGKNSRLYNVGAFFEAESFICLTEGELDAMVLHYEVGLPAIGCPGAQLWQQHFPRCFAGFETVYVFTDGDQPGREFGRRVQDSIQQAVTIHLPDGQDVNSIYLKEGAEWLRGKIEQEPTV